MFLDGLIYPEREIEKEREKGGIFWYHPLASIWQKNLKEVRRRRAMQLCCWGGEKKKVQPAQQHL